MAKAIINVNYGLNGVSINVSVISAFGVPAARKKSDEIEISTFSIYQFVRQKNVKMVAFVLGMAQTHTYLYLTNFRFKHMNEE